MRAEKVRHDRDWLSVTWEDGAETRHYAAWLRDNSPAPDARDPVSGQRLFDIALLEGPVALRGAWVEADGSIGMTLAPDGHQSRFDAALLRPADSSPTPNGAEAGLVETAWPALRDDPAARLGWLAALAEQGLALLTDLPGDPEAGAKVIALFGYPRETNYGRSFSVVTKSEPNNLAFSDAALGPHTDNPYRDPVPGLQLLHCLANEAGGGQSILVDGFAVAERLRSEAPEDFDLLSRHAVPFRFSDKAVTLTARQRVIALDSAGALEAIHYNNRSAAAFDLPDDLLPDYYRAYRRFGTLLWEPDLQRRLTLRPGQLIAFDNRRLLHGRTAVKGAGARHLVGWYAERDGLRSAVAKLRDALAA
ncbi:MAG: gamma-butyrobetaine dioxygenase [Rhodospirillales bacterium]